jgi:single-strand DNA-binding protein
MSVNRVILVGNIGNGPNIRQLINGQQMATFPIVTSEFIRDKETGEKSNKAVWHNVVMFDKMVDMLISSEIGKGDRVYVEGRINYRDWMDKDGNKKFRTEIVGTLFTILNRRRQVEDDVDLTRRSIFSE